MPEANLYRNKPNGSFVPDSADEFCVLAAFEILQATSSPVGGCSMKPCLTKVVENRLLVGNVGAVDSSPDHA